MEIDWSTMYTSSEQADRKYIQCQCQCQCQQTSMENNDQLKAELQGMQVTTGAYSSASGGVSKTLGDEGQASADNSFQ